ncbi:MAG: phosphomannomutase/phosphoglucomutase [Patescibacteria group bacterium]|jgi:phosphomannomutase
MLPINSNIFKAYDIRGIYGQDFDNELAYLLGLAYIELRKVDPDYLSTKKLQIAVGSDMRLSSPALKNNLINGLIAAGADVIDLGTVSTPTFYFAVGHYHYDGGIMISASHNPKEWNGFKIVRTQGAPVSYETGLGFLKEKILTNHFLIASAPGQIIKNDQTLKEEMTYTFSTVDFNKIKPFKIIADTANGMGATYLEALFTKLPGELLSLNFKLDGSFPSHEADPLKEENLQQLKLRVLQEKADLGIATDGDGDRIFFVDNTGETINPAIIRGLLAKIFLIDKPGAKIGYDVRPGKITVDLILENGGQPVVTHVGHSLIKEQMIKENIYFAGESSGHFYLQGEAGCFEYPGVMILKLLVLFSKANQSVADYVNQYKKYFSSGEINRTVADKETVFQKIRTKYADGQLNELDGVSVTYPDFWFNVRGSNTEPLIRLNLEAVDQKTMEAKRNEVLEFIS